MSLLSSPVADHADLRGGWGARHLSRCVVLACLAALALAAMPATAWAADVSGGVDSSFWPIYGAAALQMSIAIVVGLVQAGQARMVRLNDERVDGLRKSLEAEVGALKMRLSEAESRLAATREDYARRADLDAAISRVEAHISTLRQELVDGQRSAAAQITALSAEATQLRVAVERVITLLDSPR